MHKVGCRAINILNIYKFSYNFGTVLYPFLETGTSDKRLIYIYISILFLNTWDIKCRHPSGCFNAAC